MHRFYVATNENSSHSIYTSPPPNSKFSFYAPDTSIHPSMRLLYVHMRVTEEEEEDRGDLLSWNPDEAFHTQIGSMYVFPKHILPFHTKCLSITSEMKLQWVHDSTPQNDTFFCWVFPNGNIQKLYPFSVVVWPPVIPYFQEMLGILEQHYTVIRHKTFSIQSSQLLPFVFDSYRGDRRCDKTQLPRKCSYMRSYPCKLGFIKFLVPRADLDKNQVSKTSVHIKALLRKRFIPRIQNYIHDIICHISDNASHARSMEKYVDRYIHAFSHRST